MDPAAWSGSMTNHNPCNHEHADHRHGKESHHDHEATSPHAHRRPVVDAIVGSAFWIGKPTKPPWCFQTKRVTSHAPPRDSRGDSLPERWRPDTEFHTALTCAVVLASGLLNPLDASDRVQLYTVTRSACLSVIEIEEPNAFQSHTVAPTSVDGGCPPRMVTNAFRAASRVVRWAELIAP